jgi:DNA-directed RNA polymerase specialized sigma24 family protein
VQKEEDLVRRAQGQDPEAFGQLYEEHFGSYRYRGMPFSSWLFRIAHNQVVDHWKKKRREKARVIPLDEIDEAKTLPSDDPAMLARAETQPGTASCSLRAAF